MAEEYNEPKQDLTVENWKALTDEEKTEELRSLIDGADYKEYKRMYDWFKNDRNKIIEGDYGAYPNPVIVLELIDPVMTHELMAWMYRQGKKLNQVPLFGYKMTELHFDKRSLMNFSDHEKSILQDAIKILQDRAIRNED